MKLLVAADAHVFRTQDGKYWCKSIYSYSFWKRYLDVFKEVRVVTRVRDIDYEPSGYLRVDGPHVEIFAIPFFQGPKQLLMQFPKIHKALRNVDESCDVALLRMPSQTAQMTFRALRKNIPIGGEIVFDPIDSLKNNKGNFVYTVSNYIRIRYLKEFCKKANGLSYVTENAIQKHFPGYARTHGEKLEYFEINFSTITLSEEAFTGPKSYQNSIDGLKVVLSDVSMNNDGKGELVLIDAIRKARNNGANVHGIIIGDGSKRKEFEEYANSVGLKDYVKFTGLLSTPEAVRNILIGSDMFVLPTIAEGLPRGILEAMAVGLPVISTPVGGIPEVVPSKYLFHPKDVDGFSNMLCHLYNNPSEMEEMSENNYKKSLEFKNEVLQKKRNV